MTLASGRGRDNSPGGLIYTKDNYPTVNRVAMLCTGGDDVRVTGLRIQGPSGYFLHREVAEYNMIGIRCSTDRQEHKNIEIDNCEIYNWTMAGVYVMSGEGVVVHHNFIHTNIADGFAYGIWFGANNAPGVTWAAEANANLFNTNRHSIGSSTHWPWAARYNIFGPQHYQQVLDRHAGGSVDTWIENNWIQDNSDSWTEFRVGFTSDNGGTVYYNNNWTPKGAVGPSSSPYSYCVYTKNASYFDMEASGNDFYFGYDGYKARYYIPVAASTATIEASDPYTVHFDSAASYDPQGEAMKSHQWWLGDGSAIQGVVSYEDSPTYTYSEPGMYEVIHWAYNEYGVPGYETQTVLVRPTEGGYWLSAWVIDECRSYIPEGEFYKQVCIGDTVVWQDDIVGDEGWQHVLVDITDYVTAGTSARVSFRLVNTNDEVMPGYYAQMGIDNVHIFGGSVYRGTMESYGWSTTATGSGWSLSAYSSMMGRLATRGGVVGCWGGLGTGQVYQYVSIGAPLEPLIYDAFDSGDGAGGTGWNAVWTFTGSAAVTDLGTPYSGLYSLALQGTSATASRSVDLSGESGAHLTFYYMAESFETGDSVSVEIYDGSQWQEVLSIGDGADDGLYHLADVDLSGYSLTSGFQLRFSSDLGDAGDSLYVDNLMIA